MDRFAMMAQKMDLFKGINPHDVEKIFTKGQTMSPQKGQVLFYEGTTGNTMYVVLGGKISLFDKTKKHLADVTAGHMFGEMALIGHEPRSATAVAAEDSYLFVLDQTTFEKLMTKTVAIQMLINIVGSLSTRLRAANRKLTDLQQQPH
jgi:CRP-like cAMP-binding protein